MKNLLAFLLLFNCLFGSVKSQQTLTQINGWNAYVHLPASYSSTSTSYPTIIFFPGLGEVGTNASALISNGPGAYITQGWNGNVVVDGNTVEFIVISIQPPSAYPNEAMINQKIQTIKSLYRVDPKRLSLTGLSHGGWCSTTFVTGDAYGGPYTYASQIAAVVEVEGVIPDDNSPYPNLFDNFALSGGKLLGFEQAFDNRGMPTRVSRMNAAAPNSAIYVQTNFGGGGHCCWNQFYGGQGTQPGIFSLGGVSQNLYQWLARQSLGTSAGAPKPPANQAPTANAGTDITISLPANTVTLTGSGTDADGTIKSYSWTKLSGATATISNAASASTTITGLVAGTYQFQLTVTDNAGTSATDVVNVTVKAAASNVSPGVTAGSPQTVTMPVSSITLGGTASDADGSVVSTVWSKVSGPAAGTITNPNALTTTVNGLVQGTYVFQLAATDNMGATTNSNVTITVTTFAAAPGCNANAPVSYTISPVTPGEIYITNASSKGWKGGDTLKIPAGNYSVIEIDSFGGDPCRDIIVMNSGGLVNVDGAMRFGKNVHHVKIIGNGAAGLTYGFKCKAFSFNRANHYTMERIEVGPNAGGVGIYGKQDPYVGQPWTQYPNYISTKITINNCYVHDVAGEGMYIGHTYPAGDPANSNLIPQRQDSVTISNCTVTNTGWDGIQLANARNGGLVFGNTVTNFGTADIDGQRTGIIIGGNTNAQVYNNTISNGKGNGIQIFGYGVTQVYNNTITNVGNTTKHTNGEESIYGQGYVNTVETNPKQAMVIHDNQINYPKAFGAIRFWDNNNSELVNLYNNKFCFATPPAANWQSLYIFLQPGFTNSNNILSCGSVPSQTPTVNAGSSQTITLPVSSVTLAGSGSAAAGNTISSYNWTKVSGGAAVIASPTNATSAVTGLVAGNYTFRLTVTDNKGNAASADVQEIVNSGSTNIAPVVNAGNDLAITFPVNSVNLSASASDADGSIASYSWSKISGPAQFTISSTTINNPVVSNLASGSSYIFRLTVTDNKGLSASDDITITVNAAGGTSKSVKVNVYGGVNPYNNTEWNNWNSIASLNSSALKYSDGTASTITTNLSSSQGVADNAAGYPGIMAPSEVLRYASYSTVGRTLTISGLSKDKKYNLELYASRSYNPGSGDIFIVNQQNISISSHNNSSNKALFSAVAPTAQGQIVVSIQCLTAGGYNYLNGFVLSENSSSSSVAARTLTTNPNADSAITASKLSAAGTGNVFNIFPNPVNERFTLELRNGNTGNMTVQIVNQLGAVQKTLNFKKDQNLVQINIPITELKNGIYFVKVQIGNWTETKKIIKL